MTKKFVAVTAGLLFIAAGFLLLNIYNTLYRDNIYKEGYIYIYEKSTPEDFFELIDSSGLLRKTKSLRTAAKMEKLSVAEPGRYKLVLGMGNREIARMVKYGWQTPVNITLSGNIRTKERLAAILSKSMRSDSLSLLNMLNNDSIAESMGFDSKNFIGMFIPNTYQMFWTASPKEIAIRFKREYDLFWKGDREQKALKMGLTPQQVITLASIVSEESNIKGEYQIIAGVYLNRIKKGMPLQADPTVKYALGDFALKRILYKHLETDSPYNTYKIKGLPPGPITIPPTEAIDGVLNSSKHKYLYFCAKETLDGTHSFSETLSEHNKKAKAYQRALNRLNIR